MSLLSLRTFLVLFLNNLLLKQDKYNYKYLNLIF